MDLVHDSSRLLIKYKNFSSWRELNEHFQEARRVSPKRRFIYTFTRLFGDSYQNTNYVAILLDM